MENVICILISNLRLSVKNMDNQQLKHIKYVTFITQIRFTSTLVKIKTKNNLIRLHHH